jgi:hypothetical protein
MGFRFFISSIFLFFISIAAHSETNVRASVEPSTVRPGESFYYVLSVSSDQAISVDDIQEPSWPGFENLGSRTSSETRAVFNNGQMQTTRTLNYQYEIIASQKGEYTLPGPKVTVAGQTFTPPSVKLSVVDRPVQRPGRRPNPQVDPEEDPPPFIPDVDSQDPFAQMDEMFSQLLKRRLGTRNQVGPVDPSEAFFIDVDVDKQKVFQGEQVLASFYLYTRGQIADIDTLKYPALKGFWKEDIEMATRLNFQPVVLRGVQYQRALLAAFALFPLASGESIVDPYRARCRVLTISSLGMPADQLVTKESEEIKVAVMPLPEVGRPESFTGGVGEYQVSARLETKEVKVNQPMVLKVRVDGTGLAKSIEFPKLPKDSKYEVYGDIKGDSKFFKSGQSYKEFEVLLIPREKGQITIPEIQLGFFNPLTKSYYERTTSAITVEVGEGDPSLAIPSQQMKSKIVTNAEIEIQLPELVAENDRVNSAPGSKMADKTIVGLILVLIVGLFVGQFYLTRPLQSKVLLRAKIAAKIKVIQKLAAKGDYRNLGKEASFLINSVLGEVSGQGGGSLSLEQMLVKAPPSVRAELAKEIEVLLSRLEVFAFAPEEMIPKEKQALGGVVSQVAALTNKLAEYDFSENV